MIGDATFKQALPGLLIMGLPIVLLGALCVVALLRLALRGIGTVIGWLSSATPTNRRAEQIAQIHYKEIRDLTAIHEAARQAVGAMNREVGRSL